MDRDPPSSPATIEAQYDAVVEWGIPDHGKLQRLAAIEQPTFVANGDGDLMLPPRLSHLMAGLIRTRRSRSIRISADGFLWQHNREFGGDVNRFLSD